MANLYPFRSKLDHDLMALTADAAGNELPRAYGPWERIGDRAIEFEGPLARAYEIVAAAIAEHGFYLTHRVIMPAQKSDAYLFRSALDHDVLAITREPTGENLPTSFAPWELTASQGLDIEALSTESGDVVADTLANVGFYLTHRRVTTP